MKTEWISVNDRLPDEPFSLVCWEKLKTGEQEMQIGNISEYTPKSFFEGVKGLNETEFKKITHWMPLPEPPEK